MTVATDSATSRTQPQTTSKPPRKKTWKQASAKWIRWLHIYISMISCAVVLFFSVTGITLNHPDWFGGTEEQVRESKGSLNVQWVAANPQSDTSNVAKLEVVEHLRSDAKIRGAMKDFTVDASQCIVTFRAPGYSADVFIDRESGSYDLVESSFGFVAVMNDLHKGRDSGLGWSVLIDASAILLIFVSATGILLLLYINRHRFSGFATLAVGAILTLVFYFVFVPR